MSAKSEASTSSVVDWFKWIAVVALVAGGIFGNWYFQEQSLLNRVLALVALALVAGFLALQTSLFGLLVAPFVGVLRPGRNAYADGERGRR